MTKKIPTIFRAITIFLSKAVSFPLETRDIFNLIVRYLRTNCPMYLMDIVKNSVEIVRRKRTILKGRWYRIVRLYFTYEYRGNPVGFAKLSSLNVERYRLRMQLHGIASCDSCCRAVGNISSGTTYHDRDSQLAS